MSANLPDEPVTDIPCVTHPALFSAPDREKTNKRAVREKRAVNLCKTGGGYGKPCPLIEWCAQTTDPADKWTVRAGTTPEDRGHKHKEPPKPVQRPERTWEYCGTWYGVRRHNETKQTTCLTCCAYRREQKRAERARKAQQQAEVAA